MILGLGIDLVRTARMRTAVERWGKRFLGRVFTPDEVQYCFARQRPWHSLAVRFAAKEALIKALGTSEGLSLRDIEIGNDKTGKPSLNPGPRLKEVLAARGVRHAHLSLSHERDYGVAAVVLEG